jgi:hypothetical protein
MKTSSGLNIVMVGSLAYLAAPFFFWGWLEFEMSVGVYPVERDSIGLPLAGFLIFWFVGLAIIAASVVCFTYWRLSRGEN